MYNVLYNYDSDFSKYFKIFVDFDNEMDKNENNEDYIKVILEDKGEILDPMAKLRAVYPNVMELVREEKFLKKSNNEVMSEEVKKKSKVDLFKSFFSDIVGEEAEEDEIVIMEKIINKAERGEE